MNKKKHDASDVLEATIYADTHYAGDEATVKTRDAIGLQGLLIYVDKPGELALTGFGLRVGREACSSTEYESHQYDTRRFKVSVVGDGSGSGLPTSPESKQRQRKKLRQLHRWRCCLQPKCRILQIS